MNREQRRQQADRQRQHAEQGASAQNSSVIRMKKSVRLARIPRHKGDNDGNMASIWTPACARHWS
jgi:hypothetical protein